MELHYKIEVMIYIAMFIAGLIAVIEVNKRTTTRSVKLLSVSVMGISVAGLATAFAMVIQMYIKNNTFELSRCKADNCFEVDDAIVKAIAVLNRKGYRTAFCCSGHPDTGHDPEIAYIQFGFGEITPETLPDGWYWESDGQMEYVYDTADPKELGKTIIRVMEKLLCWAKSLPDAN